MRCAFLRGDLVIAGHAHRKFFNPRIGNGFRLKPFKQLAHALEIRPQRVLVTQVRHHGHQAAHVEPRQFGGVLRERK